MIAMMVLIGFLRVWVLLTLCLILQALGNVNYPSQGRLSPHFQHCVIPAVDNRENVKILCKFFRATFIYAFFLQLVVNHNVFCKLHLFSVIPLSSKKLKTKTSLDDSKTFGCCVTCFEEVFALVLDTGLIRHGVVDLYCISRVCCLFLLRTRFERIKPAKVKA